MVAHLIPASSLFAPENCARLVIKIGSALLVDQQGNIRRDWLEAMAGDIAERRAAGQQVILVSSGAIALGARRLGLAKGGRASLEDAQAAAAVGQIALSQQWAELLEARGLIAAQILVTLDDLEDRRRYLNASATLDRLLELDVVPVINENDSVATAEIRFGDNDRLAARIGQAARASGVVLLSDIDGLYTANPKTDPDAKFVPIVSRIDAKIMAMADRGSGSGMGSGGMVSKLEAARIATRAGINLAIISGEHDEPLKRFKHSNIGTVFLASKAGSARKTWLVGRLTVKGSATIDAGAMRALERGSSLLPAGVTALTGRFERGDLIDIIDSHGEKIGQGLAEYDAQEAQLVMGKRSDTLAELLGYAPRAAFVHRDHLVLI
ncbi:glutamate 5-kinase [Aquisediminimonas sediminicola]|uniref:glutamate 5-kinase n=1 Tax=Alteraquisediminimonas sediminicola TaxID=2676787 RepID=UPI001C8E820D|nr:glutamate 5-kinase [Aquisediminimonas sediminicola]